MSVDEVFNRVKEFNNKNVTITGGEPLLQYDDLRTLCLALVSDGFRVCIETNGSIALPEDADVDVYDEVWKYVNWIVDYKLPSSGMEDKMCKSNFTDYDYASNDFIKFCIQDQSDLRKAKAVIRKVKSKYVKFALSPVSPMTANELFEAMIKERCLRERGVILNVQLHKILQIR